MKERTKKKKLPSKNSVSHYRKKRKISLIFILALVAMEIKWLGIMQISMEILPLLTASSKMTQHDR